MLINDFQHIIDEHFKALSFPQNSTYKKSLEKVTLGLENFKIGTVGK